MICADPFFKDGSAFPCGRCEPCLINRKRLWTARLMLEAATSPASFFVTLTYSEENLPGDRSVQKEDVQLYLKRLRFSIAPRKARYFFVGEYGTKGYRPHYHAMLFGDMTEDEIRSSWDKGHVDVRGCGIESAAYVVSYVTKGMAKHDIDRMGLKPEFALMSRKPGLGSLAMEEILKWLWSNEGSKEISRTGDVPATVRIAGSTFSLGRYLRSRLRDLYGFSSPGEPEQKALERRLGESIQLFDLDKDVGRFKFSPEKWRLMSERRRQSRANAIARTKIASSKKEL